MIKTECGKCAGKGNIKAFSNVDGGRCFSCSGRGYRVTKHAPKPSVRFWVDAAQKSDGTMVEEIYIVKAHNEAAALKIAIAKLQRGDAYIPESAKLRAV
jgi:DnaJ-class molecular chaperone